MNPIKRVEIITDAAEMHHIVRILEQKGISGYTIIPDVVGRGQRGMRLGDDLSSAFQNSYLLTTCEPEAIDALVEAIRPVLQRRGGVCLVTDAWWLHH
ncbi:MAG: P-II family nitrogen regulator [Candidatus Roseilinea sp.]|uniref:P-II family nitrogen regulator n=1 Tax=Candidatus Roseilinea sp. TaxID=2838777 RepID=UPI004049D265